jgi:hypothetical protein
MTKKPNQAMQRTAGRYENYKGEIKKPKGKADARSG